MIRTLLIANRGEIALRVVRACRLMKIKSVAVYAKGDEHSLHVRLADHAVCIGPPGAATYLNSQSILSAAEITDADAIHPGYGFLAENAEFSKAVTDSGLLFIGPDHQLIATMGDKINAIKTMREHGVPTIPGSQGNLPDDPKAQLAIAERIGYPVLIKASAGGGGRGMQPVFSASDLLDAIQTIKVQAKQLFGCDHVYLEKYLQTPRHVEVQVLADTHGQVFCVGDRDCSVQRRHQKIIEEAPAFDIPDTSRSQLFKTCRQAIERIGYVGVGTIELLYEHGTFYFIEMNTRIQVEHPVTELVAGIDLIQAQIRAHAGERIDYHCPEKPRGHAIECRINAEDARTMQPAPGQITECHFPGGYGVRVDSHVYAGFTVQHYFDSLIAKIIVHADTRAQAIIAMQQALNELHIGGIQTNTALHQRILSDAAFQAGQVHIHFLSQHKTQKSDSMVEMSETA